MEYLSLCQCLTQYCSCDCTNNSGSGYIDYLSAFVCVGWWLGCEHRRRDHYIGTGVSHGATGGEERWTISGLAVVNVLYVVIGVACQSVDTGRGKSVIGTIWIT